MDFWSRPDSDLSVYDKCLPQILHPSLNHIIDYEIPEISGISPCMNVKSDGNHTTTINVYRVNYGGLIITLMFFTLIMIIFLYLWKGHKIRILKPPAPVVYYLAKTAYKQEHAQLCMILIEKEDYDVNYTNSDLQFSVFLCACFSGNADLITFLIKRGADVHSVSKYGDSALYFAVYGLNTKVSDFRYLDILLDAGCDINCQNNNGFTPLHLASSRGNLCLVQYLLLKGADPTISTAESILPYEIAAMEGHEEIAMYLKKKMA
ncbi:putative ankyrin repeat protein RF_0381 [Argiope bruennichi]|uniref:putative ankyrin repeat protein RF_0381 n=1 Tax=Argiope bruennichi TaxID=94029 RepID=UPI0024959AED|nr:putative ankyrin repeat protein RF_0381 [Argiope bruennichi]